MRTPKGKQIFLEYYRTLFESEEQLQLFLLRLVSKKLPILRCNKANLEKLDTLWKQHQLSWKPLPWFPEAIEWPAQIPSGTMLPGYDQRLFYPMNASSLLPVHYLDPQPGNVILDACAAPGGKTLALWDRMNKQGKIYANELSFQRASRMRRIFNEYSSTEISTEIAPAEKLWKKYSNYFDKVLLDAPCSSEAHVFRSPIHLERWSLKRINKLQRRQIKMITSLIDVLKPGGELVYSTCAVTPEENEAVVRQVLSTHQERIALVPISPIIKDNNILHIDNKSRLEGTIRILPSELFEPMFVAKFIKLN